MDEADRRKKDKLGAQGGLQAEEKLPEAGGTPQHSGPPNGPSLLDVVEEDYPGKVWGLFGGLRQIGKLFTVEDWLTILSRSRASFEDARKDSKSDK